MKLSEFLSIRSHCPFCDTKLTLQFTYRKQSIEYWEDRIIFKFDMNGLKNGEPNYKISYSFGDDNSFYIDFYKDNGIPFIDFIPIHLINKFKQIHRNSSPSYRIANFCSNCYHYMANSWINIDLKNAYFDLERQKEIFHFHTPTKNIKDYRDIILTNYYKNDYPDKDEGCLSGISDTINWEGSIHNDTHYKHSLAVRYLNFIPFVSKEETLQRLNNLLTFS